MNSELLEVEIRILDIEPLPEGTELTDERVELLGHEAARLRYDAIRLLVRGVKVLITAKFSAPLEAAKLMREQGLTYRPKLRLRPALMGLRTGETARPFDT